MTRALLALALAACASDPEGRDTGSTCPPVDPPDYVNFGESFFATYCTSCHAQGVQGEEREGAPAALNFDTRARLREHTSNIDKQAAFGPAARNTSMPPDGSPAPTAAERRRLGEYIACEIGR